MSATICVGDIQNQISSMKTTPPVVSHYWVVPPFFKTNPTFTWNSTHAAGEKIGVATNPHETQRVFGE